MSVNDRHVREALDRCLSRGLTFVAFRSPGGSVRIWVQHDPALQLVEGASLDKAGRTFVVGTFFSQMGHVHVIRPDVEMVAGSDAETLDLHRLDDCKSGGGTSIASAKGLNKAGYVRAIAAAKSAFGTGALKKVVLSRTAEVPFNPARTSALFLEAEAAYPKSFICLSHTPLHGTWIGATPERLLIAEEGRVLVDALAGTMPVGEAPNDASRWGAKERDEQDLVTGNILRKLELLGARNIAVDGPNVKATAPVAHLHSTVTADLENIPPGTLALALHPTPAVCGEPTSEAQAFILEHEPSPRTLYAGFWGPSDPNGCSEFHVNIRCMQVLDDHALIHVGAGITNGSNAEDEWEETALKARTWLSLIERLAAAPIS